MVRYGTVWYSTETHDYLDKLPKDSRPIKTRVSFRIKDEDIVMILAHRRCVILIIET